MKEKVIIFSIILTFISFSLVNAQLNKKGPSAEQKVLFNLKKEYLRLKAWETMLQDQEKRLKRLELEILTQQKEIEKIQEKITEIVNEINQIREANVSQLAIVYSKMKPENSSQIINNMPVDLAVKIFLKMKPNKVAKILNFVNREKAIKITEKLALYGIKINLRGQ